MLIEKWVHGSWRRTERLKSGVSVPWNRTCAIGGEVSLCDRKVFSWREAEKFVGCSRQTIVRYLGRGLKRLRFSDLEEMKIARGCRVEYRQVCNLREMEELVESNRARGWITFAYVAAENADYEILKKALYASFRAQSELVGLESEVELGRLTEPEGRFERPELYLGPRRKIISTDARILQNHMVQKNWIKCVVWGKNIDYRDNLQIMIDRKSQLLGGATLSRAVNSAQKLCKNLYLLDADRVILDPIIRYYGCLKKGGFVGLI